MTNPIRRPLVGPAALDAALANLAEERRKLREMQDRVAETSTTVHSKDRSVTMSFDGRGELEKLTFNDTRYRRMAGPELAKTIMETLAAGRQQAMEKLGGLMGSDVLPGVSFGDLTTGKLELNKVIDSFLGAALDGLPDRVSGPMRARLQGEA